MEEQALRTQICEVCALLWQQGWAAANDGNVSARLPDGSILATPTGVSKRLVQPAMLVKLDPEGRVLQCSAGHRPSSEVKMHLRCYAMRPDVAGVVHAHPPTATAFAVAGRSLDEYSMIETVLQLGAVPLAPYATPSTDEVPNSIAPYLAQHDALLLANHGALALGADVMAAYYRMETLEQFAKISLNAHLLGGAKELQRQQIDTLLELRDSYYKLPGRHPGYVKYPPGGENEDG